MSVMLQLATDLETLRLSGFGIYVSKVKYGLVLHDKRLQCTMKVKTWHEIRYRKKIYAKN